MPTTADAAALTEQGGTTIQQTPAGHAIETQWAIITPEHWEVLRREEGWYKLTDFAGYIFAERILTG